MTVLYKVGDAVQGKKIICEFERFHGPNRISTRGRHNAQRIKAEGNPALAVIDKQLDWID